MTSLNFPAITWKWILCESESPDKAKSSSAIKDKKWMRIELGDNGPGIPQQYRDTIFEPFVVGDESRTSGKGTGLGLSLHGRSCGFTAERSHCLTDRVPYSV